MGGGGAARRRRIRILRHNQSPNIGSPNAAFAEFCRIGSARMRILVAGRQQRGGECGECAFFRSGSVTHTCRGRARSTAFGSACAKRSFKVKERKYTSDDKDACVVCNNSKPISEVPLGGLTCSPSLHERRTNESALGADILREAVTGPSGSIRSTLALCGPVTRCRTLLVWRSGVSLAPRAAWQWTMCAVA